MNVTIFRTLMALSVAAIAAFAPGPGWTDGEASPTNPDAPTAFPSDLESKTIGGVSYRMMMERAYGFDEQPVVLLEARNPSDAAIDASVALHVSTLPATSMVSRVPPMPVEVCKEVVAVSLAAGETRVIRVALPDSLLASPTTDESNLRAMLGSGPGEFRVNLEAEASDVAHNENGGSGRAAIAAMMGGDAMVRFSVDPAKVYQVRQSVERDATGKPETLVLHIHNLTKLAFADVQSGLAPDSGNGSLVPIERPESAPLAAGGDMTLRFRLSDIAADESITGYVNVGWILTEMHINLAELSKANG